MTGNENGIEELDTLGRPVPVAASSRGTRAGRLGLSMPTAVAGVLLVGALVFGAGGLRPVADQGTPPAAPAEANPDGVAAAPGDDGGYAGMGTDDGRDDTKPGDEGTKPGEDETSEPTDKPEPTDEPVAKTRLDAAMVDGKVRLEWGACEADGIAYWKVVRSADESVSWPLGAKDTLIAALNPATHAAWDAKAPEGRKSWYRVFAVAEVEGELVARCASNVARVFVPGPEPTDKPTPEPTAKPTPKPTAEPLTLTIKLKEGHPYLRWSVCESSAFDYYKVVVSKDERVKWPLGEYDSLIAAISDRSGTAHWAKDATPGRTLYYRVFCVGSTSDGYKVLAASPVKAFTAPAEDPGPKPEPVTLGLDVAVEGGTVHLDWESCGTDGFVYYKVVRSRGENPSYLPWTDGTELIGVIENPGASAFEDGDVASGDVWYYRIQSIGRWNGEKVLLGETRAVRVEIP
jgi:hypothetical protein